MDNIFKDHLGKNSELYMDDMVVKSDESPHHEDLLDIFEEMRKYQIRLNLEKCSFGILGGKLLEIMITHR